MEPIIAVLPPHVIDQIAAGEVIERPASVVKELLDNAIDAGATTVVIEVAAGGRELVRVTDDGCGMSAASAVLALARHATSKLREVDDLWGIASMGFRGEALPSIASVSRMTLTTRRAGDDAATRVVIEAGRVASVTEAGAPVGTTVEVASLLHNLPARLKFLKGEATEASHVTDLVAKVAMAYPRLHLKLRHNGRTALDVPPDRDGFARAQALLGPRIAARLASVHGEEAGVRVTGYLGAPELAQATARGVQLFVGRRVVRDRGLLHALAMGYGELVPRGRYPIAIVLVDVPAGAVDVNVHPQKLEVRFVDPAAVAAAVRHVVQAGVAAARWRDEPGGAGPLQVQGGGARIAPVIASVAPPVLPFDGAAATPLAERHAAQMKSRQVPLGFTSPVSSPEDDVAEAGRLYRTGPGPSGIARDWVRELREQTQASRVAEPSVPWGGSLDRGPGPGHAVVANPAGAQSEPSSPPVVARTPATLPGLDDAGLLPRAASSTAAVAPLRYLGQLDLTYLVCEGDGELVLIDHHAAHERIELARLRARHAGHAGDRPAGEPRVAVQNLLFPTTFEATPPQLARAIRAAGVLSRVGFEVEPFGKTTLAIKAVPASLRHGDPAELVVRLLEAWGDVDASSDADRLDAVLGEIACHSVPCAGDRLTAGEAEALVRALDGIDAVELGQPGLHGRAMLLRMPVTEIGRRFGR